MKIADVTWLFGPIAEERCEQHPSTPTPTSVASSVCDSNSETRPILKRRATISEAILQHSLSSDSLIQHANLPARSQCEIHHLGLERTVSDNVVPTAHIESSLRATPSSLSTTSSETSSQSTSSRRRITFNRVVSQVIAVGREEDYDDDDDTESDSTLVTMKPLHPQRSFSGSSASRSSFSSDTRTIIAYLPPTTLKDDSDSETEDEAQCISRSRGRPSLFRTFSSDDFRSIEASEDRATSEHIEFFEYDNDWFQRPSPISIPVTPSPPLSVDETTRPTGTDEAWFQSSSGVFIPFGHGGDKVDEEPDEDNSASRGLIGKLVDIAHTVRDIAHVLWNVGWRLR